MCHVTARLHEWNWAAKTKWGIFQTTVANVRRERSSKSLYKAWSNNTSFFRKKAIKALHSWRLGSNSSFLPVFVFGNTVSYPSRCLRLMLELSHVSMTTRRRRRAVRRCVFPAVSAVLDTLRWLFAPWPPLQQRRDDLYLRSEAASPSLHIGPASCFFSDVEFIIDSTKSFGKIHKQRIQT